MERFVCEVRWPGQRDDEPPITQRFPLAARDIDNALEEMRLLMETVLESDPYERPDYLPERIRATVLITVSEEEWRAAGVVRG